MTEDNKTVDELLDTIAEAGTEEPTVEEAVNDIIEDKDFVSPEVASAANSKVAGEFMFERMFMEKKRMQARMRQMVIDELMNNQDAEYFSKHKYHMDGKMKRRCRKAIEKMIDKGKIKIPEYTDLNA